jgi:hypothetical protein
MLLKYHGCIFPVIYVRQSQTANVLVLWCLQSFLSPLCEIPWALGEEILWYLLGLGSLWSVEYLFTYLANRYSPLSSSFSVCLCIYVFICICIYLCVYMCFYLCVCMYVCMYLCVCVWVYLVCVYVYVYVYICECMCVWVCVCVAS